MRRKPGYTQAQLDDAQDKFGLRFPPDLVGLLRDCRIDGGWDWVTDERRIRDMLSWPVEGILFDVENASLWWPEWGDRPEDAREREEVVRAVIADAPRLIPLFGRRFLPEEPFASGNPVFSVHQSDIVYFGSCLANYLEREFAVSHLRVAMGEVRRIRFWSDAVDRAWDPAFTWRSHENDN